MKLLSILMAAVSASMLPLPAAAQERPIAITEQSVQAPGFYRVMLGDFKVTVLSDGTTAVPFGDLLHGADRAKLSEMFRRAGERIHVRDQRQPCQDDWASSFRPLAR